MQSISFSGPPSGALKSVEARGCGILALTVRMHFGERLYVYRISMKQRVSPGYRLNRGDFIDREVSSQQLPELHELSSNVAVFA